MSLNPIKTTESISKRYCAYLATSFNLDDKNLQQQFLDELQPEKFIKGPILEATPPFETGKTLEELIEEGLLSTHFKKLMCDEMPLDRPLYQHQEVAIRKTIQNNLNIVVATGTGSGKTEVFMITILNYLFRQIEKSELTPGVRALLLYPMNALANDQLKRLRALLRNYPDITFGRYTGETLEEQKKAESTYRKMYKGNPLPNEIISREKMKMSPPHILLTNYAMLEYLMLRPEDNVFFNGAYAGDWNFIVLDEAHTYNGAKGIEMAMLLRRLKERVVQSVPGKLNCIVTSATLGSGRDDYGNVVKFTEELFGESFNQEDVVEAVRNNDSLGEEWGAPSSDLYETWQEIIYKYPSTDIISALFESGEKAGVPTQILENSMKAAKNDYKCFMFFILKGDKRLISLRKLLEKCPQSLDDVAEIIFPNLPQSKNALISLVDLAVKTKCHKNDQSLIPARYHLFVRAIEGAYLSLYPEKKIYLERREHVRYDNIEYSVFEIGACRQCGAIYLVGETIRDKSKKIFKQPGKQYFEDAGNLEYYLLLDENVQQIPDNEDELLELDVEDTKVDQYIICCVCGAIDKSNVVTPLCNCDAKKYIKILRVSSKGGHVHKCSACARTNPKGSIVWRFLLGKDAIASVLATSLFQQIPGKRKIGIDSTNKIDHDEWSPIKNDISESSLRQLLIFSDSRQDAAFFAPYLNRTYSQILRRKLILETITKYADEIVTNEWRIEDLVYPLCQQASHILSDNSQQGQRNEVLKWLLYELLNIDSKIGLEGLGYIGFTLAKLSNWQVPSPLCNPPWNLSEDEVWTLYQILLDSFRKNAAIEFPKTIDPKDSFFEPQNRSKYFRENGSSYQIASWLPHSNSYSNSRSDFIERLVQKMEVDISKEQSIDLLRNIWKSLYLDDSNSPWNKYFENSIIKGEGTAYQMKYNLWEIRPGFIDENIQWYYCDKCHNITLFNLRNVCPTYRCHGTLQKCKPSEVYANNHYRNIYSELLPIRMRAEEHTAQLSNENAAELQTQFIEGEIDILSCSTTFELGVDVGELEAVFMRNVPPSAANYVQRAGRAGRRTDSTAFVLTFCKRSSHDLTYFNNPMKLVSGKIETPHIEIKNEKIVERHVYAEALAKFWKSNPDMCGNVESFFFNSDKNGYDLFEHFLDSKPVELYESLCRIVPHPLHQYLNLKDWGWISGLFDQKKGVLLKAKDEVENDVNTLLKVRQKRIDENHQSIDSLWRAIKTIKSRPLINFLSSHNVIPKYGFPVDVVELEIIPQFADGKLELNRDLRIALSEYAPGSQIVAGGKLWTSRYLKKLPQREWLKYKYAICEHCQRYQRILADSSDSLNECDACGRPLGGKGKGYFIVPEFGFIVSLNPPKEPGDKRPEKTYTTRTYYSGESEKDNELVVRINDEILLRTISASHGKLAIINHAGYKQFSICTFCGYAKVGNGNIKSTHRNSWGYACSGKLSRYSLGHEYMTDILQINFEEYTNPDIGFWYSLLYALLEGASEAFDIDRQDIDGCLYPYGINQETPAILLFDDVPGGAGHVKRIGKDEDTIRKLLQSTYQKMKRCNCGAPDGDTSCYGCLRNYKNQFCHDQLNRGKVITFLEQYFGEYCRLSYTKY